MKKFLFASVAGIAVAAAAPGLAADLPAPVVAPIAPAPVVAPPLWTGVYLGVQLGGAVIDRDNCFSADSFEGKDDDGEFALDGSEPFDCDDFSVLGETVFDTDSDEFDELDGDNHDDDDFAFFIGGHIGADVQFGSFVIGALIDAQWVNFDDSDKQYFDADAFRDDDLATVGGQTVVLSEFPGQSPANPTIVFQDGGLDWYGTARVRAGFAPGAGRFLIYATGGLAFGEGDDAEAKAYFTAGELDEATSGGDADDLSDDLGIPCESASFTRPGFGGLDDGAVCSTGGGNDFRWGYALGGGVEVLATNNFSVGFEALYVNLDADGDLGDAFDEGDFGDSDFDFWTFGVKGSYRFGGGPR